MNGWVTTAIAPVGGGPSSLVLVPGHLFCLFTTTPVDQRDT